MTNNDVFQKDGDKILAKRKRVANKTSRRLESRLRVESNLAVELLEEEPLVLHLRLPFNSTTTP